MARPTELRSQATTIVRSINITEDHLAVVLKSTLGPITDETIHAIWDKLTDDLGWWEYHCPASQRVDRHKVSSTTEIVSQDTSRKRKAPSELIGEEINSGSRRTKYRRRTGLRQTRHNPSGGVDDANDTAVVIAPQGSKGSILVRSASGLLAISKPTAMKVIDILCGLIRAQSQLLIGYRDAALDDSESTSCDVADKERVRDFIREKTDNLLRRTSCNVSAYDRRMAQKIGYDVRNPLSPRQPPSSIFKRAVEKAVMITFFPETDTEEAARSKEASGQPLSAQEVKEMEVINLWAKRVQHASGMQLSPELPVGSPANHE